MKWKMVIFETQITRVSVYICRIYYSGHNSHCQHSAIYVTDSEKTAHFSQVTKLLLLVYWVRRSYKLYIPAFFRWRKLHFVKV